MCLLATAEDSLVRVRVRVRVRFSLGAKVWARAKDGLVRVRAVGGT